MGSAVTSVSVGSVFMAASWQTGRLPWMRGTPARHVVQIPPRPHDCRVRIQYVRKRPAIPAWRHASKRSVEGMHAYAGNTADQNLAGPSARVHHDNQA